MYLSTFFFAFAADGVRLLADFAADCFPLAGVAAWLLRWGVAFLLAAPFAKGVAFFGDTALLAADALPLCLALAFLACAAASFGAAALGCF